MPYQPFEKTMLEKDIKRIKPLETINELIVFIKAYDQKLFAESSSLKKTYHELYQDILKTRSYLKQLNLKRGTHIGIILKNNYDFFRLFLAITSLEMVAVVLNPHFASGPLNTILKQMDVEILISNDDLYDKLLSLDLALEVIKQSACISHVLDTFETKVNPKTKAAIMFTGGTTKAPKGVLLSHKNLLRGTINGCYGVSNVFEQRYYSFLPFSHVFGLIRNGLTVLYTGSSIYLTEDLSTLVPDLMHFKPTTLVLVPALAQMLYGLIQMKGIAVTGGALETIICGGAPVSPKLPLLYAPYQIKLYPGYGLTESANLVSGNSNPIIDPISVGIPYPYQTLKVVNQELWLKGENMMLGYYNNKEANEEAYEDGWFKTGDLVSFEKGVLTIIGRKNNLIVLSNGEKVAPEPIENDLSQLEYIKDALVYHDPKMGDMIACEVFLNELVLNKIGIHDPMQKLKSDIDILNQALPNYAHIRKIHIRDKDFDRSPSMKIIRKK